MTDPETFAGEGPQGFVLGADDGDRYHWLGTLSITKVLGSSTGGRFDVVDHRVPSGYAPPTHVHRLQDELFVILEGRFTLRCGDRSWDAVPGSLAFLPRAVPHGYAVSHEGPGRALVLSAPSGFADLIRDIGTPAPELALPGPDVAAPDPQRVNEASRAHGIDPSASGVAGWDRSEDRSPRSVPQVDDVTPDTTRL